jgi:replicative DNA helicase
MDEPFDQPIYDDDLLLKYPLPQNLDAERLILGCILLDNGLIKVAEEWLTPEDFFLTSNLAIYDVMVGLARQNRAIDPLTVQAELRQRGQLERAGGPAYLASLFDGVPRFSHIENYCRIVAEASLRRRMVSVFNEYMHLAVRSEHTADELLDKAQREVMALQPVGRKDRWQSMAELGDAYLTKLETLAQQDRPLTGLATGFTKLDNITGGLQSGTLTILAARPSAGKSAFALNLADGAARDPYNTGAVIGIFSLEMSAEEYVGRYLAMRSSVDSAVFRTRPLRKEDWRSLASVLSLEDPGRIFLEDRAGLNTTEMRALARRLRERAGRLDLLIVDYLQIIRSTARGEQRYRQLGLIAEDLKAMGKDFGCPVIAVCALGREAEDHEPTLRDLRESGDLEFVADLVWFLHGKREDSIIQFIQAKQRNGPLGRFNLRFAREFSRFEELAWRRDE